MASNDVEVLDPETAVEKKNESGSGFEVNRRNFIAALGVAGAAAGAVLVSSSKAFAQQPSNPNGYAQVDVLNLMLNIKYLKATLYSYITQGTDLPPATFVTEGSGTLYNYPAKVTFTSTGLATAQQITDLFNEMYYDELNQLIALRALQGIAVIGRPTMNLLGTGPSGTAPSTTSTTITPSQAIGLARMLEDLSASAFATAAIYLTGTNLALASQALATDGFHAGAMRLLSIQTGAQYYATEYEATATSNTAQTAVTFYGLTTAATNTMFAYLGATTLALPAVGNPVSGNGIPEGTVITAVTPVSSPATNSTFVGVVTSGSKTITAATSITGLAVGQIITGTDIPANTTIASITTTAPYTVSLSAAASATPTAITATGFVTSGSNAITSLSTVTGLLLGQSIAGTGIATGATITAINSTAPFSVTISAPATANSSIVLTAITTSGSAVLTSVSAVSGFSNGAAITGTGIPAGATVVSTTSGPNTITISAPCTATSPTAENITIITTETVTVTGETLTVGTTAITFSANAGVSGVTTISVVVPDSLDVEPADVGSAAANGPQLVPGSSPALYQGFFNTAGAATSSGSQPAGFAFARTFQQVLGVLYGYNSSNAAISTQNYEGGFFPFGAGGGITSTI